MLHRATLRATTTYKQTSNVRVVSWLLERRTDRASHRAYCTLALSAGASQNEQHCQRCALSRSTTQTSPRLSLLPECHVVSRLTPSEQHGLPCAGCVERHHMPIFCTKIYSNRIMIMESTYRNSLTPEGGLWLTLRRLSQNSRFLYKFCREFLYRI